jgi:hypothetical protein
MVVVEPETLEKCDFEPILARDDEQEALFLQKPQELQRLRFPASDVIKKLQSLHDYYGCPNLAVCDFDNILAVDIRPRRANNPPQRLSTAEFAPMGKEPERWRQFQNFSQLGNL